MLLRQAPAQAWDPQHEGNHLAASDSCTSSSTESARQDRLSMEARRRRPAHRVAIAARPSSRHSRSPRDQLPVGLRLGLGLLRPHFRLGPRVTGRAGSAAKSIRPGNGSRCGGCAVPWELRRPLPGTACARRSFEALGYLSPAQKQPGRGPPVSWEVLPSRETPLSRPPPAESPGRQIP